MTPTENELQHSLLPAIAAVKAGQLQQAALLAIESLDAMAKRGADHILLACTELPLAAAVAVRWTSAICIDTTRVLARVTVEHWRSNGSLSTRTERHLLTAQATRRLSARHVERLRALELECEAFATLAVMAGAQPDMDRPAIGPFDQRRDVDDVQALRPLARTGRVPVWHAWRWRKFVSVITWHHEAPGV